MRSFLHRFDTKITHSVQQWPDWIHPIMTVFSFIGQPVFTLGIGAAVIALGWVRTNIRLAFAGAAVWATIGVGAILKLFLRRDRPITDYVLAMRFDTFSFPSGHALGATIAYGLLAYLTWQLLPAPWNYAAVIFLAGVIIVVGLSRVYLGAHYPSDVAAGWLLGAVCLAIIIFVIQPKL